MPNLPTAPYCLPFEGKAGSSAGCSGTSHLPQTPAFISHSLLSDRRLPSVGWRALLHPFCLSESHLEGANQGCFLFP